MIEIIVRNDPPEERRLLLECKKCESIIIADYEDIEDDGSFFSLRCPVCSQRYATPTGAGKDFLISSYFKLVSKKEIEKLKKLSKEGEWT